MFSALVTASATTSRGLSGNLAPDGLQGADVPKGTHGEDESPPHGAAESNSRSVTEIWSHLSCFR